MDLPIHQLSMTVLMTPDTANFSGNVHVFDPARFPYAADTWYRPAGGETGTAAQLGHVLDTHG